MGKGQRSHAVPSSSPPTAPPLSNPSQDGGRGVIYSISPKSPPILLLQVA